MRESSVGRWPQNDGGVLGLAVLIMLTATAGQESDTAKLLLSSILPLLGTWVGTVLAYYFAKENFESAARATGRLAGIEKLRSILNGSL